ncbi:O-Antigen ligase [Lentimicrobium saccharophilum]|uniref:O-Antigen ligase n=2 Tax=Lentimicrobium saccharophilum TaxID=1678841 RepID=A0A0S7BW83_9BACT|nr:O-Antigen ligase [Lentimicrobium saccharophilum]
MAGLSKITMKINTDASSLMFYTLVLLAISIPLSEFGMSISQFILLGIWIFQGSGTYAAGCYGSNGKMQRMLFSIRNILISLSGKFRMLFNNPAAMVVVSLYLLHVAGTLYSSDLNYALKDLRIKLPLLSIPVILATSPGISAGRFRKLMIFFTLAVFTGTLASTYVLLTKNVSDPRDLSIFISHIRFSLTICFAIFILIYFLIHKKYNHKLSRFIIAAGILWFLLFLFILESITGIFITGLLTLIFLGYYIFTVRGQLLRLSVAVAGIILTVASVYYFRSFVKDFTSASPVDFSTLDKYTEFGTPYIHDTCTYGIENGQFVGLFLCPTELRHEWNKRSKLSYDGVDKKGHELNYTLIRFLHSKGYRKDARGVRKLTDAEIRHIENGVANADYLENFNLKSRFEQIAMGYSNYIRHGDPNASSVMQRFEYWKTSIHIVKKHWLTGVGTGDLNDAFYKAYNETGSKLQEDYRKRSHNQFLAIFIAFGVFGLAWFLFTLIYPAFKLGKFSDYYYVVFFIIIFMSMLTEDTLETQAGATFFAFFNALLLFGRRRNIDDRSD